jgi:serine/threonine-protein kinase
LLGTTIAGRYYLVRLLGDGGMGAVYKAADQVLRRFVAIKLLHPNVARNPSSVERFQREARAAAAIGHPNIIDILDFGMEGTRPYMVMEYLRGRSLSQILAQEGALAVERACAIATHTLAGLAAAHDRGILHRDLKPANLMLISRFGDRNFVKVCDFGFAALFGEGNDPDAKTLTPERTLVGTPAYAAPERLRGDDRRDPRTDVYSVGVVLFEMLAGRRPFDAPTFAELARKVRNEPPPSLRSLRPDVPEALDRVVRRALSKVLEERWASAEEFAAALVPFGGRKVQIEEDVPSDSFAFEMMRIKARDAKVRGTKTSLELPIGLSGPGPSRPLPTAYRSTSSPPSGELSVASSPAPPALSVGRRKSVDIPIEIEPPQPDSEADRRLTQRRLIEERARLPAPAAAPVPSTAPPRPHPAPGTAPSPPGAAADRTQRTTALSAARAEEFLTGRSPPTVTREDLPCSTEAAAPPSSAALHMPTEPAPPPSGGLMLVSAPPAPAAPVEIDGLPKPVEPAGTVDSAETPIPLSRVKQVPSPVTWVRGRLVVSVLRFVARRFGERALKELLDALPSHIRAPFDHGIEPEAWVDFETLRALVELIDARLGQNNLHLVLECGRATAEGAFDLMRRLRPPSPPPELLLAEMPSVMQSLCQGIELQVRRLGKGYGRLELVERGMPSLTASVLTLGFLERSLERFGAEDVEVNLLSSRALEDPQTLIDVSWLG